MSAFRIPKYLRNFRQTHRLNWYVLLWSVALILVVFLSGTWIVHQKFIGIVERKSHLLGFQESGRIDRMLIFAGQPVEKGQVLAVLDVTDLKNTLDHLQTALTKYQQLEKVRHHQTSMQVQRMALELENEAADLIDYLSGIEAKTTELTGLNREIERLQKAEKAGLGHSREMSALILKRDALASYLKEQNQEFIKHTQEMKTIRSSRRSLNDSDIDSMAVALFMDQTEYPESLRRRVFEAEHRIQLRTMTAPCAGFVTEMMAGTGDVVNAFAPVLTIEESQPSFVEAYISESSDLNPETGMHVDIYSSRGREHNTRGIVEFVHPGFTRANERLSFRRQIFWARKIRIGLPENHSLVPGEVVTIQIHPKNHLDGSFALIASQKKSLIHEKSNRESFQHRLMTIPPGLSKLSRFEPSGVACLPDSGKFLIVSDDTGIKDRADDHAPYLFMMDRDGNVSPDPVQLSGIDELNDLEAITPAGENQFYLISSQNISKKQKRPGNREWILKIEGDNSGYQVTDRVQLLSLILRSYSPQILRTLGLEIMDADGLPELNIEGATFHDHALYLGLKEPVPNKGAIIWKLESVDDIFNTSRLKPDQLMVYGHVRLGKDRSGGISDLLFDEKGVLWALSTNADAKPEDQIGEFYRIKRFSDGRMEGDLIHQFPGLKPEGLCMMDDRHFLIVFDRDQDTPRFCTIDMERL